MRSSISICNLHQSNKEGLTNIASEISEINSRVTDIINLYANANRNVGHDVSPTTPVPTTPVPTTPCGLLHQHKIRLYLLHLKQL